MTEITVEARQRAITPAESRKFTDKLTPTPLFRTIPPERIGLNGEYDHQGLAKRVVLAFKANFDFEAIENLYVAQRGRVVILRGQVSHPRVLRQLMDVAMTVNGATDVETQEVLIGA